MLRCRSCPNFSSVAFSGFRESSDCAITLSSQACNRVQPRRLPIPPVELKKGEMLGKGLQGSVYSLDIANVLMYLASVKRQEGKLSEHKKDIQDNVGEASELVSYSVKSGKTSSFAPPPTIVGKFLPYQKAFNEAKFHKLVSGHKNIVNFIAILQDPSVLIIEHVSETFGRYCVKRRKEKKFFTLEEGVHFLCQIIDGVCHIHEKGIEYADLDIRNLLMKTTEHQGIIKISDFGVSRPLNYYPPEAGRVDCYGLLAIIDRLLPIIQKKSEKILKKRLIFYNKELEALSDYSTFLPWLKKDLERLVRQESGNAADKG